MGPIEDSHRPRPPEPRWDPPRRNLGLAAAGAALLVVALVAGAVFVGSAHHYVSVGTGEWGAFVPPSLVQAAKAEARTKMLVSALAGLLSTFGGVVLLLTGLRPR